MTHFPAPLPYKVYGIKPWLGY